MGGGAPLGSDKEEDGSGITTQDLRLRLEGGGVDSAIPTIDNKSSEGSVW